MDLDLMIKIWHLSLPFWLIVYIKYISGIICCWILPGRESRFNLEIWFRKLTTWIDLVKISNHDFTCGCTFWITLDNESFTWCPLESNLAIMERSTCIYTTCSCQLAWQVHIFCFLRNGARWSIWSEMIILISPSEYHSCHFTQMHEFSLKDWDICDYFYLLDTESSEMLQPDMENIHSEKTLSSFWFRSKETAWALCIWSRILILSSEFGCVVACLVWYYFW